MDFKEYETFLENLSSVMSGLDYLINEAVSHEGHSLVWSPIQPNVVSVGELESIRANIENIDRDFILPFVLRHIDEDNYVVELTYAVDEYYKEPSFYLSVGY